MRNFGEKYYLGLDLGTSSVGWAVTDENYELRRAKGKDLWGARLFDEASTSVERRSHRSARRRAQREKARRGLLRELFAEEIAKVDSSFYARMDETMLHKEDRSENNQSKQTLFVGTDFNDADYYKKYPTIFHLRKAQIENDPEAFDIRMLYLSLLNMYKRRGNFLNANLDVSSEETGMKDAWEEFVTEAEYLSIAFEHEIDTYELEQALGEKGLSKSQIFEKITKLLGVTKKDKSEYELLLLICGRVGKMINIYGSDVIDDEHKSMSFSFRDSNYEEKESEVREYLGDEYFALIESAKKVHDIGLLANIMKGQSYLSCARVELYENHKQDLALLKKVLKSYDMDAYNHMFRVMEDGNYSAYIGSVNSDGHSEKIRRNLGKGRNAEDLYKKIKGVLAKCPQDDPDVMAIQEKISAELFLPKQLTSANGVIPNQVYVKEMKKILANAEQYHPFLAQKDESGLSVSERILSIFSFRIPYFVGPLGQKYVDQKNYNVWSVRKESGRIYPWNFEEKIDTKKTAEKFISRMVGHCSYLNEEQTLPKCSLLYERFMVLNELNNIKIHGEAIPVEMKQELYNTLFLTGKKVSVKAIEKFFKTNGIVDKDETDFLSGIDIEGGFKSSLSSYGKFKAVVEELDTDEGNRMVEQIIFWMTVYGDDKKFVKEQIQEHYGEKLSKEQIKRILGYKIEGWGNLSKEFLQLEGMSSKDGMTRSIIRALWETNDNLMQLLSENYTYKNVLDEKTQIAEKLLCEWEADDLDGMYLSAPVKRMVWQTIKIMRELSEVTGKEPDRVFVEMPREDGEKGKRSISRKKKLSDLYQSLKKEGKTWKDEIDQLTEAELRSKKLYLYYVQMGRCMYTGNPIDLHTLLTDNLAYDIDHIYPRRFIKDDSIENNLVLVEKTSNARKLDFYPILPEIREKQKNFWKFLYEKKFISSEKYMRLTRTTEFTDEEKAKFISRQLVETRQGTKVITQIIQQAYPNTTVVFSKAGEVSEFRKKYDLTKVRCINDLHHAKDAYLNIVVGNTYYVKFTANPLNYIREAAKFSDPIYKYNMDKIFCSDVIRNGEVAWRGTGTKSNQKHSDSLEIVKTVMKRNTPLITRRAYIKQGGLTNKDTIFPAKKASENPGAYMPTSTDSVLADTTKYGGRTGISGACYCLVAYDIKGKQVRSLESVPVFLGNVEALSEEKLIGYFYDKIQSENKKTISNLVIKRRCIKFNSLVKIDGHIYYLGGKTGSAIWLKNAKQFKIDDTYAYYIKKLEKSHDMNNYDEMENGQVVITLKKNEELFNVLTDKLYKEFKERKGEIYSIIQDNKNKFIDLSLEDQVYVLMQIVTWFAYDQVAVDLDKIGGYSKSGTCRINKKISELTQVVLISQSVTGLYSSEIDLLTL